MPGENIDPKDQAIIDQYVNEMPSALPDNNPEMRAAVNHPGYVDRGMWGPYGGPNGTISQIWLHEWKSQGGGA
ncbi:MAG TPA: hypothetical protein VGB45_07695 [Abditibacterium sp.]|jgi:hypothetical protein